MRLFLHSGGRFAESEAEVRDFFGSVRRLCFVPYALDDLDGYTEKVRTVMEPWGFAVDGLHEGKDPQARLADADALFMGGGNTFRLLTRLVALDLVAPIVSRVTAGMPYAGSSAGSNMACPTIMTTNDMPIVYPPTFDALGLVPFQINPHYLDAEPDSDFHGETREKRLSEYHEMNTLPVVGLREGSLLRREGPALELRGSVGARLFLPGAEAREFVPGDRLDFLLSNSLAGGIS